MEMILASFACLSWTKMMSSPVASTILSHCLLKSHGTLNPVVIFYHFLWGIHNCTTDLPIPVLSSHTVANAHTTPHCLVSFSCPQAGLTCTFTLLGDLITLSPFSPTLSTYRWFWGQPLSWDKNSEFLSNFLWSRMLRRGFHTKPGALISGAFRG